MNDDSADVRWDAVEEGIELLREGDLDGAIAELERISIDDPRNEHALFFLGNAYFERQDYKRALKGYLAALELEPAHLGAMVAAGHTLRLMGRLDEALRVAVHARAAHRDDPDVIYLQGVVHFVRGENAAAHELLTRYLETRPELETAIEVEGMLQTLRNQVLPYPGTETDEA